MALLFTLAAAKHGSACNSALAYRLPRLGLLGSASSWQSQQQRLSSTDLRSVVAEKIPAQQERLKAIKKAHGDKVIGDVTVGMCIGGMRGITVSHRERGARGSVWDVVRRVHVHHREVCGGKIQA